MNASQFSGFIVRPCLKRSTRADIVDPTPAVVNSISALIETYSVPIIAAMGAAIGQVAANWATRSEMPARLLNKESCK